MKLSIGHMAIGLILIVAFSYYFNREGFSVPRVVPLELDILSKTNLGKFTIVNMNQMLNYNNLHNRLLKNLKIIIKLLNSK
jgi:hypothetical protein